MRRFGIDRIDGLIGSDAGIIATATAPHHTLVLCIIIVIHTAIMTAIKNTARQRISPHLVFDSSR